MGLTLSDFNVDDTVIRGYFESLQTLTPYSDDLTQIFNLAMNSKTLFPQMPLSDGSTYKDYISSWVNKYLDAEASPQSSREASPKTSCSDPAIKTIVQIATNESIMNVNIQEKHHNLFMSAENVQGSLLEEYIASEIRKYGWLWCKGNVVRSVDFLTTDGTALLQIKNKSNTENSSSSAIRTGTQIEKWYRLGTKRKNGAVLPDFKWSLLNDIVDRHKTEGMTLSKCGLSEDKYQGFLKRVAQENPRIISNE